jgi:hypothetical protein
VLLDCLGGLLESLGPQVKPTGRVELGVELWTLDGPLARNAGPRGLPVKLIETA